MDSPLSRSPTTSMSRHNSENCANYIDAHHGVLVYPELFARESLTKKHIVAEVPTYRNILEDATQKQKVTLVYMIPYFWFLSD